MRIKYARKFRLYLYLCSCYMYNYWGDRTDMRLCDPLWANPPRTVARKSSLWGHYVCAGRLDIEHLLKYPLIYSVSYFNFGGFGFAWRGGGPPKSIPVVAGLNQSELSISSDVPGSFLSSQSHKPFESESSKIFCVESESWLGRVRVESQELSSHFESLVCKLESMSSHTKIHIFSTTFVAMKWCPTCYKMAPDKLENGVQVCFNKFDCRWLTSKFSQFAFYLALSLSLF